jgi:hypothetical protein
MFLKKIKKKHKQNTTALLFIVFLTCLIAVYDTVMSFLFMSTLEQDEQNPAASWIINQIGVSGLVQLKSIGTILAAAVMCKLVYTKWRICIVPVFFCQLVLFFYISFYVANEFFGPDMWRTIQMFINFYR